MYKLSNHKMSLKLIELIEGYKFLIFEQTELYMKVKRTYKKTWAASKSFSIPPQQYVPP